MSQRVPPLLVSQEYRACAKECRRQAKSFRDRKTRSRVIQIAADYERKARKVEASALQDIKIK
jgi:hypothetical protein